MNDYYSDILSAERLRRCYEIAPERVRAYLEAEIAFVVDHLRSDSLVVELGCGFGRVLKALAPVARTVVGIDTSLASLLLARRLAPTAHLAQMNAVQTGFADNRFDLVVCIQNGISAFHVKPTQLVAEALRITKPGGVALFSSYAVGFWEARLDWFERQAAAGLLGEIDYARTGHGEIVCKDGFTATTVSPEQFKSLAEGVASRYRIAEVDASSLFCILNKSR